MPASGSWKSWVLGSVLVALLVAAGYLSVESLLSRNDLEEKLSGVQQALAALQPAEPSGAEPSAGAGSSGVAGLAEEQDEEGAAGSDAASKAPTPCLAISYPKAGDTLVLSSVYREVQVALTSTLTEEIGVVVRLVVGNETAGDVPIGRVLGAQGEAVIPAQGTAAVPLRFEANDLPPAGTYKGWLTVTSQEDAVPGAPSSRQVSVAIVRPALSVAGRGMDLSKPAEVVLSGVRRFPSSGSKVDWAGYTLRLWEGELLPAAYTLVGSELVDGKGGHSGRLTIPADGQPAPSEAPMEVLLAGEAITYTGEYTGTLAVYADGGRVSRKLAVVARVRDSLWWPGLLIFFGALLLGWLMRVSLGDSQKSVPVLRHRVELARRRLRVARTWSPVSAKCAEVERDLSAASVALDVHDVTRAVNNLQAAETILDQLEKAWQVLLAAESAAKAVTGDAAKAQAARDLEEARNHYLVGNLSKVEEVLPKLRVTLDGGRAPETSGEKAAEPEGVEALTWKEKPPELRWKWKKDGLHPLRPQKTPKGVLILYSDEACTFSLVGPDDQTVCAQWESGGLADPAQGEEYHIAVSAKPDMAPESRFTLRATVEDRAFKMEVEVRLPYLVRQPGDLVAGDSLALRAIPRAGVEEAQGTWSWQARKGAKGEFEPVSVPFVVSRGHYQVAGWLGGRLLACGELDVARDPAVVSRFLVKYQAWLATILVAAIATIAGLVYIGSRVPTFGSPGDYLLALGWAFGLSGSVAPKEGLAQAILSALGQAPKASDLAKVPDLKGKTLAEARELGGGSFVLKADPATADATWTVDKQDLAAGEEKPKGSPLTVTLTQPDAGLIKVPSLKGMTLPQAIEAIAGNFSLKTDPSLVEAASIVDKQDPAAEEKKAKGSTLTLTFKKPG